MTNSPTPLIAHVIFRLDVGGLENGLVNLINGLPYGDFRHAIICIDRSTDFAQRINRDDVKIVDIRKRPGFDVSALWRLYRSIKSLSPDVLHSRNLAALDALVPGLLAGVKIRIHGEHGWDVNDLEGANRKLRWLRKLHSPFISHYVTVSRDLQQYLTEQVGVEDRRISQIYNGVDTHKFHPNSDKLVARASLHPSFATDTILFGTVGRMQAVKGHATLATAFAKMIGQRPELQKRARLIIVGDGETRKHVTQIIREANLDHICWFPGYRDDISTIMSCLDVFVQPSLAEGISNTVLEAMACGLPVIATRVGGNPELVQNNVTGRIVRSNDPDEMASAMCEFVESRRTMDDQGIAARQRAVDFFSHKSMMANYGGLYERLLCGISYNT